MGGPSSAEQITYGDDRVGKVKERFDDAGAALVAAGEAVEGVLPGVGALDVPPPGCLDGRFGPLACDLTLQIPLVEYGAGRGRVVAGVEVDGYLVRKWTKSV